MLMECKGTKEGMNDYRFWVLLSRQIATWALLKGMTGLGHAIDEDLLNSYQFQIIGGNNFFLAL